MSDPRTPVLVGVGTAAQRTSEPADAIDAAELMIQAARAAGADADDPGLLARAQRILVPQGSWSYPDPARLVAAAIGAEGATTVLADLGVLQHTVIADTCADIASGDLDVALVVGGEARFRAQQAGRAGVVVADTAQPEGTTPDLHLRPAIDVLHPVELAARLVMAVADYALLEDAFRREHQGVDHEADVAVLWARFSEIAAANPDAWDQRARTPEAIAGDGDGNRMLATPYRRLHATQWNVDQAGALLICSAEVARVAGVARDKWVFPRAGLESNHMVPLVGRAVPHRCQALAVMGEELAALCGMAPGDADHVDLYSCFPSAVRIQVAELGIDPSRDLTVTGGMTFAGGPFNNYVLQSTVAMARRLRNEGGRGLVTTVSGMLTKQGMAVWATEPPPGGFRRSDVTAQAAAATPTVPVVDDVGGGTERAATTVWDRVGPERGVALIDHPDGTRSLRVESRD